MAEDKTQPIAQKLIDFVLTFHDDKYNFKDDIHYISAMKFLEFHKEQDTTTLHYVPNFNIDDIKDLSSYLHKQFESYYEVAQKQENQLNELNEQLIQCNQYMQMAESPMKNLMKSEKILYLHALQNKTTSKLISSELDQNR